MAYNKLNMPVKTKITEDTLFLSKDVMTKEYLKEKEDEQNQETKDYVLKREEEIQEMLSIRDQKNENFGLNDYGEALTLSNYIKENERRINSITYRSEYKDDWQSNTFDPVTRNKLMAILARLASQRMKAEFFNQRGISNITARVITNLYEASARGKNGKGKDEKLLFDSMFEAVTKGTVVRETLWYEGRRQIKTNKKSKSKLKEGEAIWNYKTIYEWEDVFDRVIPLECFIPGDITKHSIQAMGRCATYQAYDLETFKIDFGDFDNIGKVKIIAQMDKTDLTQFGLSKFTDNEVRVTRYWNRNTDTYDVIANGILLTEIENPLPYKHKQIPLQATRFEYISLQFFYGMSLPFKLASFQDMSNTMWDLMLDQMFIALKSPIFNATNNHFDMDWYYPSAVIDLEPGTDLNAIREFKVTPQSNQAIQIMNTMKQAMNESTNQGFEQTGAAGVGRTRTAEEVATAREASLEVMGLFLRHMEWFEEDRAEQKIQLMLEFYPKRQKSTGMHRKVIVDQIQLLNDELGTMEVNIRKYPRRKGLLNKLNEESESNSQVLDITPEEIRNFKGVIRIIPNSSLKETKEQEKSNEIAWQKLTSENPLVNQEENLKDLARVYGKNLEKVLAKGTQGNMGVIESMMQQQGKGSSQNLDNNNLKRAVSQADQLPKRGQEDV